VTEDWQADLIAHLPDRRVEMRAHTFESAAELIRDGAWNRRMHVEEYIGRAALAFAVYDAGDEVTWKQITYLEAPLRDKRRHNMPRRRLFGREFGSWEIERLR
jgi:hypothetical protein